MSANMAEAYQRQREALYAHKTDTQLIMIALCKILEGLPMPPQALMIELFDRYAVKLPPESDKKP
jgi:hypothetical protein